MQMIKKLRKEKVSRKTTKASAADDDGEKQRDEEAKIPLSTIIAQVVTMRDKSIFYHSLGCHVLR